MEIDQLGQVEGNRLYMFGTWHSSFISSEIRILTIFKFVANGLIDMLLLWIKSLQLKVLIWKIFQNAYFEAGWILCSMSLSVKIGSFSGRFKKLLLKSRSNELQKNIHILIRNQQHFFGSAYLYQFSELMSPRFHCC